MIDYLSQFAISNSCISLGLAIVAWTVHRTGKWPQVAHLLWLLVLAKLVMPPIFSVPVVAIPGLFAGSLETLTDRLGIGPVTAELLSPPLDAVAIGQDAEEAVSATRSTSLEAIGSTLILLWGIGSVSILAWSLIQIYRFNHLLCMASRVAPPELQRAASGIAQRLRVKSTPTIYTMSAHLLPMVWWIGGRVRILIPANLTNGMSAEQLRWILAHELSHVRRRDYLARWLEWLACVLMWWNPVTWWARRNLRINEEVCCDALVLTSLAPEPRTYAKALLTAVEFLASPAIRPPAMVSEVNSGGFLERRLNIILSKHPVSNSPRWLNSLLLCSCVLLPLGGTYAQDRNRGIEEDSGGIGTAKAGMWSASSGAAHATTGDIRITESRIAFANGSNLSIRPAYPGAKNVFAVDPAADPAMLNNNRLCGGSPVTYVTLFTYHAFALAVHMHDGTRPPDEPTRTNVHDLARRGKCASYYYHLVP